MIKFTKLNTPVPDSIEDCEDSDVLYSVESTDGHLVDIPAPEDECVQGLLTYLFNVLMNKIRSEQDPTHYKRAMIYIFESYNMGRSPNVTIIR